MESWQNGKLTQWLVEEMPKLTKWKVDERTMWQNGKLTKRQYCEMMKCQVGKMASLQNG